MKKYQDILFVSTGIKDETEALKQALSIARNNQANMSVLITHPKLPAKLKDYANKHQQALKEDLHASIHEAGEAIGIDTQSLGIEIETEDGKPVISIVKRVLKKSFDLVIKQAEEKDSGKGFKALDMDLLRQCPCPVWLCRPISSSRQDIKIAVAIDAESETEEGRDLSIQLLQAADMLAKDCSNAVNVISCWNYDLEEYLNHNPWTRISQEEVIGIVMEAGNANLAALNGLIKEGNITSKAKIHHLKGQPEEIIPEFIDSRNIDILLMGTVARSGIRGFLIGNTAENILQKVGCSLLAMKPKGFISPVKAY